MNAGLQPGVWTSSGEGLVAEEYQTATIQSRNGQKIKYPEHSAKDAQHREELHMISDERQNLMQRQPSLLVDMVNQNNDLTRQMNALVQQNNDLTEHVRNMTQRIEALTIEVHGKIAGSSV